MKIDSVKLQRKIRDKAYRKYKNYSLAEEVLLVQEKLEKKGLTHFFDKKTATKPSPKKPPKKVR
jgi:hypothetical protein